MMAFDMARSRDIMVESVAILLLDLEVWREMSASGRREKRSVRPSAGPGPRKQ